MRLIYKQGTKEKSHLLGKEGTTIGRSENNVIHIDDNSCSRNHCVIEYRDKNYHITDLRSFNGIKINGEKVTTHTLKHGDVITLGKIILTFEDFVIPDECSVTASHLRKIKQPTIFTEILKWQNIPYAKPFVFGLLSIFFISLYFRIQQNYDYYLANLNKYHQLLKEHQDTPSTTQKIMNIIEVMPGTSLEKVSLIAINRFKQKDMYFENAHAILHAAKMEYEKQNYSPKKYIKILQSLLEIYIHESLVDNIYKELERARSDYEMQIRTVFSGVEIAAQNKLNQGNYNLALKYYRNFIKDYPIESWNKKAEFEITKIYAQQGEDWALFSRKIQSLQSKSNFLEARMLTLMKYEQYIGTPLSTDVQSLLDSLKEDTSLVKVQKQEEKNANIPAISTFLSLDTNQELLNKGNWPEITTRLEQLYKKTPNAQNKKTIKGYIDDFASLSNLQDYFLENWKNIDDLNVPLGNKEARIRDIKDKMLILGLSGELGTIQFRWESLPAKVKISMLEKVPLDQSNGFGLASLCMINSLEDQVHSVLISILKSFPSSKSKVDDFFSRWTGVEIPEPNGFIVFRDLLIHPQEKVLVEYREKIKTFCRKQLNDPKDSFVADLDSIYSDIQNAPSPEIKDRLNTNLGENLFVLRKQLLQNIRDSFDFAAVKYMEQLKQELDNRRTFALELIFDEKTYPADETKGAAAQPDVDKRVASVREIWETPSKGIEKLSPKILQSKKIVSHIDSFLSKKYVGLFSISQEDDIKSLDVFIDGRLDIKNYASSPSEHDRINYNNKVMMENNNTQNGATETERKQVAITNSYRHMMGRYAVKINNSLTNAARKHSAYLRANNLFAHIVPGEPEGETPAQRARTSGYSGSGVGENIYMGRTSPQEAHDGWVHSAGHHRNILHPMWKALGAGQDSNYWTQKFGNQ